MVDANLYIFQIGFARCHTPVKNGPKLDLIEFQMLLLASVNIITFSEIKWTHLWLGHLSDVW